MIFRSVVLPHPLGPKSVLSLPRGSPKLTSLSASTPPSLNIGDLFHLHDCVSGHLQLPRVSGGKSFRSSRSSAWIVNAASMMIETITANISG